MRLLVFSDLHRDLGAARAMVGRAPEADVVVGAGDFATMREGLAEIIDILSDIDRPTVVVPGNGESDEELRVACGGWASAHVLHGESTTIDGVPFFGIGAAIPITPFGDWSFDISDEIADGMLADCPGDGVLVSHSPPLGHVDGVDQHFGSRAVLEAIERARPRLVVCGHIHDCWGQSSQVGETLVLNAGPTGRLLDLP